MSHKKLNFWGAVASIIGIPLAFALYWAPQTASGGDTVNVNSTGQKGGITANQVNITTQPGMSQPGQVNGSLVYPDKEMLAIQLTSLTNGIRSIQATYDRCKKTGMTDQCQSILDTIGT
jgi:hypothetical protein